MQIALTSKLIVSNCQGPWEHITNYTYTQTYFSPLKCAFDLLQQKWIAWTAQSTTDYKGQWGLIYSDILKAHNTAFRSDDTQVNVLPADHQSLKYIPHRRLCCTEQDECTKGCWLPTCVLGSWLRSWSWLIYVSNSHWPKQLFPHASKLPPPCQNTTVEQA